MSILDMINTPINAGICEITINSFILSPSSKTDSSIGQQTNAFVWDDDAVLSGCLFVSEVDVRYPEIADVRRRNDEGGDGFCVGEASVFPA